MRIKVGDWVTYRNVDESPIYRVAEVNGWSQAVIYEVSGRSKYARTVDMSRLECVNV
ncbi:hypothetical protein UFOVP582_21 [uncultured Caudovirales phage]|uniref:Uncharacterized protein n=1 Tax=uncultured Caudovirales phage TaxID=2100421 RepID=A0A6J5MYK4_9CAUD|nr:hypothetical protein UFOVP582_21 [uncultured Caudovirales phage]CAB4184085.1 hypothetical protein UFOVP1099_33 [uncultured Caudovirales phage]CAB4214460.1 hypothetical protein UFOVP1460_38 [uncultured Caudovirales phage]CAB5228832.1 hypothetical protein UFOVP1548_43 [uncultured Caudovirales phage]